MTTREAGEALRDYLSYLKCAPADLAIWEPLKMAINALQDKENAEAAGNKNNLSGRTTKVYIDKDELQAALHESNIPFMLAVDSIIQAQPAANVRENKPGALVKVPYKNEWRCLECRRYVVNPNFKFCPWCGSDLQNTT